MKTRKVFLAVLLSAGLAFTSCQDETPEPQGQTTVLPTSFAVDIPDAISYDQSTLKSEQEGKLSGRDVYEPLGYFIKIGEGAAEIVQAIIRHIAVYNINGPMDFVYTSDEDGRDKHVVVVENSEFAGKTWEFQLTITDVEFESNTDGGKGLQIFWNTSPIEGIALLKPRNINAADSVENKNAVFRIDYTEANLNGYSNEMTVYIANLPLVSPLEDPYSCNAIKLWAGKEGAYIDVCGNSNHPNARFFEKEKQQGFNWAFVASSNEDLNIACVEVALPPSNLDKNSRQDVLEYYGVRPVFEREIYRTWPELENVSDSAQQALLDSYLEDADAPGYFSHQGFEGGGTRPSGDYTTIEERIQMLVPFNPLEVSTQVIEFK